MNYFAHIVVASRPEFERNLQNRLISAILGTCVALIFIVFLVLNSYCDPITSDCGISARIAAWQATQTPNMTETQQVERTATAQSNATATQFVNITNTAVVNATATEAQFQQNGTQTAIAVATNFFNSVTATAQARNTLSAQITATRRVEQTATAVVQNTLEQSQMGQVVLFNSSVRATLIAQANMTNTASANDYQVVITRQAATLSAFEALQTQVAPLQASATQVREDLGTAVAELTNIKPDHFIAHGVNQVAYFTYDTFGLPVFIEDIFIVAIISCLSFFLAILFTMGITYIFKLLTQ